MRSNVHSSHSHVAALSGRPAGQYLWSLPLLQLHILQWAGRRGHASPPVGGAEPPQLGREVPANQNAPGSYVAMDTAFAVQVLLHGREEDMKDI